MSDRSLLGPADVSDAELTDIVADWIGADRGSLELLNSSVEVVPYDLEAITTAGRYWLRGQVSSADKVTDFSFFVKHIQSWARSPQFQFVPPEHRAFAEAGVPWRSEALVYRSDLASRLPPGLAMPRTVAVRDLDERSAAVWLEEIPAVQRDWTTERLARAAFLLGRLAARPAVQELAGLGEFGGVRAVRGYFLGRLSFQVLPVLLGDDIWRHPLVADNFGNLRHRLLTAVERIERYVEELERMQTGAAHGDACTNNILFRADTDDMVLIDFGFWYPNPLGFDLSQLLLGDVQLGRGSAGDLPAIDESCTAAYIEGLRAEGCEVPAAVVRRGHALLMLIFSGLSAIPFELLAEAPTDGTRHIAAERAVALRYMLDLVDDTA